MNEILERLLFLAEKAYSNDEIPVSAVVVKNNKIIGEGINTRHNSKSVIGHAEINAICDACENIGDWRLDDCEMYVTLLPCMMCTGAIVESRIKKIYYLCNKTNVRFDFDRCVDTELITNSEYSEKYLKILRLFFENKRK